MAEITMPQLGETVTEGTITRWAKQVGDQIAEDEVLFEVSTDKVDSEVPSPVAGVVSEILVPEGETVDVGTRLAVISDGGEAPAAPAAAQADEGTAPAPEPPVAEAAPASASAAPAADVATPNGSAVVAPPGTGQPAPEPSTPAPVQQEQREAASGSEDGAPGRVLSPVVRRLIAEHNLDPNQIPGTGAGGRITRSDVLSVIDRRNGGAAPAAAPSAPAAKGAPAAPTPAPAAGGVAPVQAFGPAQAGERDEIVPFTNIRRRTAEHMIRSKHTSAHTMVAVEVDYFGVEKARSAAKAAFREAEGFGLTYLPFITRAVVDALEDFPHVNSSVGEDSLIVHRDVNIGIAVDLDFGGLLVPVIHQADGKRLRALARDISGLAAKARSKRLTMDDISDGTFTITNAGPFGTFITVPVINQPQVAILSTDGVKKRPVVVEMPDGSDGIAVHPVGNLVMSWDHRAFDGAYAAAFVRAIKDILETRDWSAEL
ncbi:MAG TPA: dihydrolipoamide acetyltransferase family protein [Acidimicrobiales bacterium]|nr:dihydrolipoamide acetyltransferase family protein [Acidimicrobiales bacterium]